MISKVTTLAVAALVATTLGAQAAPIDLSPLNNQVGVSLSTPEVTLTAKTGQMLVAPAGTLGTIFCAIDTPLSLSSTCANSFTIEFATASNNVKLSLLDSLNDDGSTPADKVTVSAFDTLGNLLTSIDVVSADLFPAAPVADTIYLSTISFSVFEIASLEIESKSALTDGGFFYTGLEASPIPLPAALPLMALGLGALGFARSRKRKAA